MKHQIIAISREFGSGGREIGKLVAEQLGIQLYDKALLQMAAERSGLSAEFLEQSEQRATSSFLFSLVTAAHAGSGIFFQGDTPINDKAFFAQSAAMREIAEREPCVLLGCGAVHVLRTWENCLKIFLYAPLEQRIAHVCNDGELSKKEAKEQIQKMDKGRANYYRYYTGETWGNPRTHDLSINTATLGKTATADLICTMARAMGK